MTECPGCGGKMLWRYQHGTPAVLGGYPDPGNAHYYCRSCGLVFEAPIDEAVHVHGGQNSSLRHAHEPRR
jgi:hypothetical protein